MSHDWHDWTDMHLVSERAAGNMYVTTFVAFSGANTLNVWVAIEPERGGKRPEEYVRACDYDSDNVLWFRLIYHFDRGDYEPTNMLRILSAFSPVAAGQARSLLMRKMPDDVVDLLAKSVKVVEVNEPRLKPGEKRSSAKDWERIGDVASDEWEFRVERSAEASFTGGKFEWVALRLVPTKGDLDRVKRKRGAAKKAWRLSYCPNNGQFKRFGLNRDDVSRVVADFGHEILDKVRDVATQRFGPWPKDARDDSQDMVF